MNLLSTKLARRMAIAKSLGFIVGLIGFLVSGYIFKEMSLMIRLGILFWYTTLWGIVWLFWFLNRHPAFQSWKFPCWFRWIFIWGWMNFVLALFAHDSMLVMMKWTFLEWWSPFWIILEWMFIWVIIEFFATKFGWEGKELLKD